MMNWDIIEISMRIYLSIMYIYIYKQIYIYIYISKLRVCELHNRYVLGGDFPLALWDVIGIHA